MLKLVFAELLFGMTVVGSLLLFAWRIRNKNYWKADTVTEAAGDSTYATLLGLALSYFFAFEDGAAVQHSASACVLFSTFLYPFFVSTWIADWRDSSGGRSAFAVLLAFCTSISMLGGAAYFASIDSVTTTTAAEAVKTGYATGVVTTIIALVLATFVGCTLRKSSI